MVTQFYKMHGTGNDYILFDCMENEISSVPAVAKKLSDRHFGIGGDGVILLCPSSVADVKMRMFNADGSEGKMCGNGIRLLGKLFYELGYTQNKNITVETQSGIKSLALFLGQENKIDSVKVDMGAPVFSGDRGFGENRKLNLVSMGNPHCVLFSDNLNEVVELGPRFQKSQLFPDGINTEVVHVESATHLSLRVWERGSGETLSCGTGACAAVAAAVKNKFCQKNTDIAVTVKGGELIVNDSDSTMYLTGGAELVYEGRVRI